MNLLVFAHKGEAEYFYSKLRAQKTSNPIIDLYSYNGGYILTTGEGLDNSLIKTTIACTQVNESIDSIINIGVCASLDPKIAPLNTTHSIRHVFKEGSLYSSSTSKISTHDTLSHIDLVSALERVTTKDYRSELLKTAPLIDREAASVALTSKVFKKDFYCYKHVSDYADDTSTCHVIKNQAPKYSQCLYEYYLKQQSH